MKETIAESVYKTQEITRYCQPNHRIHSIFNSFFSITYQIDWNPGTMEKMQERQRKRTDSSAPFSLSAFLINEA